MELERTRLGAQAIAKSSSCIKNFRLGGRKNRTGIGAHPPGPLAREIPVISRVEAGYVRSSEFNPVVLAAPLKEQKFAVDCARIAE